MSFPVPVTRMRLEMPFWVLILGTGGCRLLGRRCRRCHRCRRAAWCEDHEQVLALEQRRALDDSERLRVIRDPVENPPADVLVDHLAAPEHDRHLNFLSCFEELLQTLELRLEIVLGDLRSQLHLLQLGDVLLAALVLLFLDRLELVASVVDQAADWRARLRRHLNEIESLLACDAQSGVEREHSQLVVLVIDQPHLRAADLIVDLQLFKRDETLPRANSGSCYSSNSAKQNKTDSLKPSATTVTPSSIALGVRVGALLQVQDRTGNVTRCAKWRWL